MSEPIIIELLWLPKISLNKWYQGFHWTKRKKIKDEYIFQVRQKTNIYIKEPCNVEYLFEWESRPLDASNCIAMVKLIEDCIFIDDGYQSVQSIKILSRKSEKFTDRVLITIKPIQ